MTALPHIPEDDRFGPSALLTPANAVTIIRMLLSPALLVMVLDEPSSSENAKKPHQSSWASSTKASSWSWSASVSPG